MITEGWILNRGLIEALDTEPTFESDLEAAAYCYAGAIMGSVPHVAASQSHFRKRPEDLVEILGGADSESEQMAIAIIALRDSADWDLREEDLYHLERTVSLLREQLRKRFNID